MALDDRLAAAASVLREETEARLDFYRLREMVLEFVTLLLESDRASPALKVAVRESYAGLAGPVRKEFMADYERAGLKSAYFLLGIYEALYGSR